MFGNYRSYPRNDLEPYQCLLRIKPKSDTCWIRFDFTDLQLGMDSQGSCAYDSMGILNSPDGPGGRLCGDKSGYSTLTSVRRQGDSEIALSVIVQEPDYRWNVKITQISCSEVHNRWFVGVE